MGRGAGARRALRVAVVSVALAGTGVVAAPPAGAGACGGLVGGPASAAAGAPEAAATRARLQHPGPRGRLARPEEIAEPVLWLLSDRSSYTTGSLVGCDGGVLAKSSISV